MGADSSRRGGERLPREEKGSRHSPTRVRREVDRCVDRSFADARGDERRTMGLVTTCTAIARRMGYRTQKFVKIVDWRLALTNLALQVLITFYVLYALIAGKTYLETEVPVGRVTNWGNGNPDFYSLQSASATATTRREATYDGKVYTVLPCAGTNALNDYKFVYDDAFVYDNIKCAYLTPDELITKQPSGGLFITTHVTETVTYREPKATTSNCAATHTFANGRTQNVKNASGTGGFCYYAETTEWLTIGSDVSSIGIAHEYETLSDKNSLSGKNPKTFVRRAGSSHNYFTFESGKDVKLKLKDILDIAQVDLDKRYEAQPAVSGANVNALYGEGVDAARTPMTRLGGLRINAKFQYYNYNLHGKGDLGSSKTPYAILEIEPSITWTSKGQSISYRTQRNNLDDPIEASSGDPTGYFHNMYAYGVFIDVTTSGIIGGLNYVYIINVIVSGLVLLNVAGTITDLIAQYGLGTRSLIYRSHMIEETNFERECAKYAVQGMLAVSSFKAADKSGNSDGLDIDELNDLLVAAFHSRDGMSLSEKGEVENLTKRRLSLEECRQMAKYIMLTGDSDAQDLYFSGKPRMSYDELKQQRIDLNEWIELMTEGPMDINTLRKVIKMDKEEQDWQKRLMEAFRE